MTTSIKIIQPDDWHVHFREDEMLKVVTKYSSRVNRRCIAMPNTSNPITSSNQAVAYKKLIESNQQDLYYFSIIYELIDHVKQLLSGLLEPDIKEEIIGIAEVKDVYRSSKIGAIAGSIVSEGIIQKDQPIRVLRDNVVIFEGELESLRRFKDDVKEVQSGTECGIGVKDYNDVKPGDQIEVFKRTEIKRTIQ